MGGWTQGTVVSSPCRMGIWLWEAMESQSVGVEREQSGVLGLHGSQGQQILALGHCWMLLDTMETLRPGAPPPPGAAWSASGQREKGQQEKVLGGSQSGVSRWSGLSARDTERPSCRKLAVAL